VSDQAGIAYALATGWLAAAGADVRALERDCSVAFHVSEREGLYAPIFWVAWRQPAASVQGDIPGGTQAVATVWLVEPERRLLQMSVENPQERGQALTLCNTFEIPR
jgi:hypothetical protein